MQNPKQVPEVQPINKSWARFYQALGTFNTNMVYAITKDPTRIDELTDFIVTNCTTHHNQCNTNGGIWDDSAHTCIRLGGIFED
jgi:hypothetical protein